MLTQSQFATLSRSLRRERVLSVYIDGTVTDPSHRGDWRAALDHALDSVRDRLSHRSREERDAFGRAVTLIEQELATVPGALRAPGWVGFATAGALHHCGPVPVRMPTTVAWGKGVRGAPYARLFGEERPAIVVVADARRVDVYGSQDDVLDRLETIHAHHEAQPALHMGNAPHQGFHQGTRGGTGRDQMQHALDAGTDRLQREAVDRVLELAGTDAWLLTAGTPRRRSALASLLGESAADRVMVLDNVDVHASEATISVAARAGAAALREQHELRDVAELIEAAGGHGKATAGTMTTRAALDRSTVHTLMITRSFVERCPTIAELAVRFALAQGAVVREVSGEAARQLDLAGGIVARLRYRS